MLTYGRLFSSYGLRLVIDLFVATTSTATCPSSSAASTSCLLFCETLLEQPFRERQVELSLASLNLVHLLVENHVVRQWDRTLVGALHVYSLGLRAAHPLCKLHVIADCSREHHDTNMIWQLHDDFLPDRASVLVVDVVHLVEDDPLDVLQVVRIVRVDLPVEHLSGHNDACGVSVDAHITSKNTNIFELGFEVAELLIGQSLDGRSEHSLGHVLEAERDRVLCDNGLAGRGVRSNEHA